jgi:hypothetical protein
MTGSGFTGKPRKEPFANWFNCEKAKKIVRTVRTVRCVRISDGSDALDDELRMFYVKRRHDHGRRSPL